MTKKSKKPNTIGARLQIAFNELGISREEAAETIGTSLASVNRYLCDQEPIPEIRMELLLLKKGISKTYIFENKGEPKADWEERLYFIERDRQLINKIRHDQTLWEITTKLSKLSAENLKFVSTLVSKLKR
ncbi:hypothetical protein LEP1GSC047_2875 [Leptospira inadai serovar Lyme str. 10]|uniref:DNA-binding helix-turn-helix protein n=2 Tax=Leptospira inadai serovar Lyme TaxID=293084 RepID=V6HIM8_9LEPT|nr:hypothetical protein [Leptospira inadai]EQA36565.1 hypothetical protein LEP1GSC047_2875 [Leptospira inadai serovar Lyme str. 10]PNV73646.1 hypothetical protein BES34_016470 [Leptospira inadai serovar Lyme]